MTATLPSVHGCKLSVDHILWLKDRGKRRGPFEI